MGLQAAYIAWCVDISLIRPEYETPSGHFFTRQAARAFGNTQTTVHQPKPWASSTIDP